MKAAIIIPARLESTRLPRKLLLDLGGKSVLQRTYEQAMKAKRAAQVIVATDSEEILSAVAGFGGEAVMSRRDHQSGSERAAEAASGLNADIIVNVQGDEPEIDPAAIDALIETHSMAGVFASTLACPFPADLDPADPAAVKVVFGKPFVAAPRSFEAIYFTRAAAPYARDGVGAYHLHVGVYAFSADAVKRFAAAPLGRLEQIEKLEQLRILEMGEKIAVRMIERAAPGIDTPGDYDRARMRFSKR